MTESLVRLVVDPDRCIGSGMCEMLEEATFIINEDTNLAEVVGRGVLPEDRALIVIDRCPATAIAVAPDGDDEKDDDARAR